MNLRHRVRLSAAILIVAGLVVYAGSTTGPFVLDDPSSITANPTIRQLWPPWDALLTPKANVTVQGRPLLNLSFAVNYAISGYDVWSYHALNLAIHLLAGLTLFGVVRRTLVLVARGAAAGDDATNRSATWLAFGVALLWTLHPLQTESVTYVVQRAESLMGLCYLLTLYGFIRHVRADVAQPGRGWAVLAVAACAAGMATKEVMVTAPVMVLLYDRAFVAGSFLDALRVRWKFHGGLASTWLVLGACMMRGGGNRGGAIGFGSGVAWWDYGLTQFEAIGRYLLLTFWPHPLVFEYGAFKVGGVADVLPWAAPVLALMAVVVLAFLRRPKIGFLGAWFFGILAPTSLVPGTSQMIVEHRIYLSLAAVIAGVVWGVHVFLVRGAGRGAGVTGAGGAMFALVSLTGLALGAITLHRNAVYQTAHRLWAVTVAQRPGNPLAHHLLAEELVRLGKDAEAETHYREAARLDPGFALAHERLGEVLTRLGRMAEAQASLSEAVRLRPDFADAHHNLATVLAAQGRASEALSHVDRAIALQPDFADAHFNRGNLLTRMDRAREAVASFSEAVRLNRDFAAAHFNLANTLFALERPASALGPYREALRVRPDFAAAEFNLANALASLSRREEAIEHYRRALSLQPDLAAAEMNLGRVLAELGRVAEAETHLAQALRLDPGLTLARELLAELRK